MATKTAPAAQPEATDAREEGPDAPLLDTLGAELKKLVQKGKERGYVTYDELNAALPPDEVSSEQIEDTMTMLSEAGVNVIEAEEQEEAPAATPAEPAKTAVVAAEATGEDEEPGRTDDPLGLNLREKGSGELRGRDRGRRGRRRERAVAVGAGREAQARGAAHADAHRQGLCRDVEGAESPPVDAQPRPETQPRIRAELRKAPQEDRRAGAHG